MSHDNYYKNNKVIYQAQLFKTFLDVHNLNLFSIERLFFYGSVHSRVSLDLTYYEDHVYNIFNEFTYIIE